MNENNTPKFLKIACAIALASTTAAGCSGTTTADSGVNDVPNAPTDQGPPPGLVAVDAGIAPGVQVGPDASPDADNRDGLQMPPDAGDGR